MTEQKVEEPSPRSDGEASPTNGAGGATAEAASSSNAPPDAAANSDEPSARPSRLSAEELDARLQQQGRFSEHDAERFAASLRPSWEPPPPTTSVVPLATAPTSPSGTPRAHSTIPVPMSGVPMFAIVMAGVIAVGLVIVFAVAGGDPERPEGWSEKTTGTSDAPASTAPTPEQPPAQETLPPPPPPPSLAEPAPAAEPEPSEAPPAEPEATGTAQAAAQAEPAAPTKPTTAQLRVVTDPPTATLMLDGAEVANPFDGALQHGSKHVLKAKMSGYTARKKTVTLDGDRQIELRLDKTAKRATARKSTKRKAASKKKKAGAAFVADSPY